MENCGEWKEEKWGGGGRGNGTDLKFTGYVSKKKNHTNPSQHTI